MSGPWSTDTQRKAPLSFSAVTRRIIEILFNHELLSFQGSDIVTFFTMRDQFISSYTKEDPSGHLHGVRRVQSQVATSLNRPIHPCISKVGGASKSPLQVAPYPIRELLQSLKTEEDQDCGRLQPAPCRDPAFEHERVTFVCYGCPNSPNRGRRPRT